MTTTAEFQKKPDFYLSQQECLTAPKVGEQTNPRYRNFTQTHFTIGDEEQFSQFRDAVNGDICIPQISMKSNVFTDISFSEWSKYKNLKATAVINTFRYIFNKFKKGIFVKITNNKLRVFLPFSKANFINEWSEKIKVDPSKYTNVNDFLRYIAELDGRPFNPKLVNSNIDEWFGNNCLIRYDLTQNPKKRGDYFPSEGESNIGNVKNMLEVLCASRVLPDIEFFINRRDFPLLTRDETEAYDNIFDNTPLVSNNYSQYSPILSMSTSDRFADIAIPTWEDWARVQNLDSVWFPKSCRNYNEKFDYNWESKIPTAVFRGGTTGCGVTIETNMRLKLAYLSSTQSIDDGIPYLDAGVTKWNLRPRKLKGEKYLKTIDIEKLPFTLVPSLTPLQQSKFKYIINVDGHVSAFRLSIELNMGSVILLVKSSWKLWYSNLLVEYVHYVPIKEDLSDLISQVKWCRKNDDKCKQIVANAREFFNYYLQKDGVLDYMQKILVDMKKEMGVYLYNSTTPLNIQIEEELNILPFNFPETIKTPSNIGNVPIHNRCFSLLQGIQWVINMINTKGDFEIVATKQRLIQKNKLGIINLFKMSNFLFAVKSTRDNSKIKEHIHDAFIGTCSLNNLTKYIPNFAYIFGYYVKDDTHNVITEYIHGITLFEYIKTKGEFNFQEFLFIIIQICLALEVAQRHCALVHYDLTPWNIILQKFDKKQKFDYILGHDKVMRIYTNIIPVIIDYGKSHVVYNQEHHGFINMFSVSTVQDILTLLITSMEQILNDQYLSHEDFQSLVRLANFFTNTEYRKESFSKSKDLRDFLRKARKYSALIADNKGDKLEQKTPIDLIKHIWKFKGYDDLHKSMGYIKGNKYQPLMNTGNARQVFDFILSENFEGQLQSYMNVCVRLKHCTLPQPTNLFFVYYVAQSLENNLTSVYNNMLIFLESMDLDPKKYTKELISTREFIRKFYKKKIQSLSGKNIEYNIKGDFKKLILAPYNEETFLLPETIKTLLEKNKQPYTNLYNFKEIIELVLLNSDENFQLSDKDIEYYVNNFKSLLSVNMLYVQNNIANIKTLTKLASVIYNKDSSMVIEELSHASSDENCQFATEYKNIYEQIQKIL